MASGVFVFVSLFPSSDVGLADLPLAEVPLPLPREPEQPFLGVVPGVAGDESRREELTHMHLWVVPGVVHQMR